MRLNYFYLLFVLFTTFSPAQEQPDVLLKNVSDTILNTKRTLKIADPLNNIKVMQKLFPGKLYNLADKNTFVSWNCKNCKPAPFADVNEVEGDQLFPYERGVATRILSSIDYSDSKGNQFRILTFNHSAYDEDGLQTGRFSGGLLGIAKFAKNGNVWEMRSFQPAVAAFGSFAQCPTPKLVEIGEDQYALSLVHANGGAGAPYNGYFYLIAGFDGKYQSLMEVSDYSLTNSSSSDWSSTFKVVTDNNKKFFRDFIITTTGSYKKAKGTEDDFEVDLPEELATMGKTKKQFNFVIERHFSFKGKFYKMTNKPIVKFSNIK
ncbi:hypothetical protein [Flavobacterium branchiicola]|uniref:Uncharacterized protein n=1 Tax=Flavobacterium branchiicola TaxID=1114875 RepID=A0ABV9PEY8_9FLAO|nr:hypothetical protein [Flavobacterium branchiicola]MBS7253817.1 hypothetical protein [Flavobacterium branchiicola]